MLPPDEAERWVETLCQLAFPRFHSASQVRPALYPEMLLEHVSGSSLLAMDRSLRNTIEADKASAASMILFVLVEEVIYNGTLMGVHRVNSASARDSGQGDDRDHLTWQLRLTNPLQETKLVTTVLSSMLLYDVQVVTDSLLAEIQRLMGASPIVQATAEDRELVATLQRLVHFRIQFESCWRRAHQCSSLARGACLTEHQPVSGSTSQISSPVSPSKLSKNMTEDVHRSTLWVRDPVHSSPLDHDSDLDSVIWMDDFFECAQLSGPGNRSASSEGQIIRRQPWSSFATASPEKVWSSLIAETAPKLGTRTRASSVSSTSLPVALQASSFPSAQTDTLLPQDTTSPVSFPWLELCTPRETEPGKDSSLERGSPTSRPSVIPKMTPRAIPKQVPQSARAFFAAVLARYGEQFLIDQLCTGSGTGMVGSERHKLSRHAEDVLTHHYEQVNIYPSAAEREQLAQKTGLNRKQICWWFSNRRMREKRGRLARQRPSGRC
jgi:hypothetical protein